MGRPAYPPISIINQENTSLRSAWTTRTSFRTDSKATAKTLNWKTKKKKGNISHRLSYRPGWWGCLFIEVLTSQITLARVRLTNKQTTTETKQNTNQDKEQCHWNPTWEICRWETSPTPAIGRDFPLWGEEKSYKQWMEKRHLGAGGFGLSKVVTKIQDSHRTIWHPISLSTSRPGAWSVGLVSWAIFQTVPCFVLLHFQMKVTLKILSGLILHGNNEKRKAQKDF